MYPGVRVKKYTLDHKEQGQCIFKARAIIQSKGKTSSVFHLLPTVKASMPLYTTIKWASACKYPAL